MNIEEELLDIHSKAQAVKIANHVGNDQEKFDVLMRFFFDDRMRVHQRAAMPMSICAKRNPALVEPYLRDMLKNLNNPVHDAVIRNTVRLFQDIELPEDMWGETWDICFTYLESPKYAIAIRVFSMTVLANLCKKFPEMSHELQIIIEDRLPYESAGFKSRGRRVIEQLKKMGKGQGKRI